MRLDIGELDDTGCDRPGLLVFTYLNLLQVETKALAVFRILLLFYGDAARSCSVLIAFDFEYGVCRTLQD